MVINIFKSIKNKFKSIISLRLSEKKIALSINGLVKPGIYKINFATKKICKVKKASFSEIFHVYFVLRKSNSDVTEVDFIVGAGKYVCLFEKSVLCIPKKTQFYYVIKSNYLKYSSLFTYPHASVLFFNDADCTFMEERIIEKNHFKDFIHDCIVIERLLELALDSPMSSDKNKYLQHSDVKRDNICWIGYDKFVFIDIDNIGFKPIFFDIIHYSSSLFAAQVLVKILKEHSFVLRNIFNRFDINKSFDEGLDIIFSNYIAYYQNLMPNLVGDFSFLRFIDKDLYPLTNKLLN